MNIQIACVDLQQAYTFTKRGARIVSLNNGCRGAVFWQRAAAKRHKLTIFLKIVPGPHTIVSVLGKEIGGFYLDVPQPQYNIVLYVLILISLYYSDSCTNAIPCGLLVN